MFTAARAPRPPVRLHAEQLSNQNGAALAARYKALSADHLEHLDDAGAKAMATAGTVAVLLPGAFYALQEKQKPPVELLREHKVPIAIATDCNPGTSPLLSPTLGDEHGLHLVRADARRGACGHDHQRRARARPCARCRQHRRRQARRSVRVARSRISPSLAIGSASRARTTNFCRTGCVALAAALVAIICWAGLAIQFWASLRQPAPRSARRHSGCSSRFFTILTNLVVGDRA